MAIDPRIALNLQSLNVGQRFGQNIQNLRNVDILNQQRDFAPIQLAQAQRANELGIAQQPSQIQAAELAASPGAQLSQQQQQNQQIATQYAQSLKPFIDSGDAQGLADQITRNKQTFQNLGVDTAGIDDDLLQISTPEGLAALGREVDSALQVGGVAKAARGASTKAFAPVIDPATGELGIPTFDPVSGKAGFQTVPGAPVQQTPSQKREAEIRTKVRESQIAVSETEKKEVIKQRVARTSALKKEFSERNRNAARSKIKISEARKLVAVSRQGLGGVAKVNLARVFPGIDAGNESALVSAFKSLALDELQKFSGPTTDFEFTVTEDIAGSLGQGKSANTARLASLERAAWFAQRESKQFNEHVKAGHDPDQFGFNFNELVTPKKGGPSYTLRDLQDTAVANHISIDEVTKRLSE